MALDPRIILAGRSPDIVGSLDAGAIAGQRARMMNEQNALNAYVGQNAPNIMAGNQNALNGLANFGMPGLEAAQGVQNHNLGQEQTRLGMDATRQGMQATAQRMRILDEQQAAQVRAEAQALSAQELDQQRETIRRAQAVIAQATTPQAWDAAAQANGMPELVGGFEARDQIIATLMDTDDLIAQVAPQGPVDPLDAIKLQSAQVGLDQARLNLEQDRNPAVNPMDQVALDRARVGLEQDRFNLNQDQNPAPDLASRFDDETSLRKEWNGNASVKAFATQVTAYGRMTASASDPSPAGDLSLIFNYMKVLDPGSVVRESEFATAANAGAVDDRIRNIYNRVLEGERLAPEQRADFLARAGLLYESAESEYDNLYNQFSAIARRNNLSVDNSIVDYRFTGATADPANVTAADIASMTPAQAAAYTERMPVEDIPDDILEALIARERKQ